MRILNNESFKLIAPLMRENYANLHAQMSVKLSPDVASMFAKYTQQPSMNGAQWSVTMPGEENLKPFSQASEAEQDQISMSIKRACAELKRVFPAHAEKIVEVPDNDAIYFCSTGNRVQVVLTQWGFHRIQQQANTSIIKLCLERAEKLTESPVMVHIVGSDGKPMANKEFTMLVFNNEFTFETDENGMFNAGHLKVGTQFRIETENGAKSEAFTVDKDRELYDIRIQKETSLTIRITDEEGTPLTGINTTFEGNSIATNADGEAVYEPINFDGPRTVTASADGYGSKEHTLVADPKENLVIFTHKNEEILPPPDIQKPELPEVPEPELPEVPEGEEVRVQVVDKKGFPLPNYPVKVFCQRGFEETYTDAEGWITLKSTDLVPGEQPRIELMRPKAGKGFFGGLFGSKSKPQPPVPPAQSPAPPAYTRETKAGTTRETNKPADNTTETNK